MSGLQEAATLEYACEKVKMPMIFFFLLKFVKNASTNMLFCMAQGMQSYPAVH